MSHLEIIRSEDYLEYFLFPQLNAQSNQSESNEETLERVYQLVNQIANEYCSSYIFHKDSFKIAKKIQNSHLLKEDAEGNEESLEPHLHGVSHFGDNIQDEWFLVSLIFKLTREIPGLIARIVDSDGEFMLIEAADHLPHWANPETCEQRVYIHAGQVNLIQNSSTNIADTLSVSEAIQKIREQPNAFLVSKNVESCIMDRIKQFPENLNESFHQQVVYVPVGVASVLRHNPQLIAPAVIAFCHRDPIDMKICRAMRYFPPENRVYTSVRFTKCLYAMLTHSNYLPDRRTGWNLPPSTSKHFKAHLLGVKLACGFEILASQQGSKDSPSDFEDDREWKKYVESLNKRNYFDGQLEGSKDHTKLLKAAKDYYVDHRDSMRSTSKVAHEIVLQLKSLEFGYEDFKKLEASLPESDSDNWLQVAPEELDEMLTKRYGIKNLLSGDANANGNLTEVLAEFLDQKSEFDGIDINENVERTRVISKGVQFREPASHSPIQGQSNRIDFDPDAFTQQVQNMLDLVIPEDKWESNSDMSDYENDDEILSRNIDEFNRIKKEQAKKGDKKDLLHYMAEMDRELAKTTIGKSFEKKQREEGVESDFDDIEDFEPVDIDMNAVKNMMESYKLQGAAAGPTSNLLSSILDEHKETQM